MDYVHINMVVGVPFSKLAEKVIKESQIDVYDIFGNISGKAKIIDEYARFPNDTTMLVGSNRYSINNNRISHYTKCKIDYEEGEYRNILFCSSHSSSDFRQIIAGVGLRIEVENVNDYCFDEISASINVNEISAATEKSKQILRDTFGYVGDVYVISLVSQ